MSPIIIAVILLAGGLAIAALSHHAQPKMLATVCFWVGIVLAACGAVMILAPAVVWLDHQLRAILGAG